MQQVHLFDRSAFVERATSVGTTVRLKLEPLGEERVRVLEYHRRGKGKAAFRRVRSEEGIEVSFAKLGLSESYDELFSLAEAA